MFIRLKDGSKLKLKYILQRITLPVFFISLASIVVMAYFGILISKQLNPIKTLMPKNQEVVQQKNDSKKIKEYSTTELIKEKQKYIVEIFCATNAGDVQASGIVIGRDENKNLIVLTNYHVIKGFTRFASGGPACFIRSETDDWSEAHYAQPTFWENEISKKDMEIYDFAFLTVKSEPKIKSTNVADDGTKTEYEQTTRLFTLNTFPQICSSNQLEIGEDLIVLGFPDISGVPIPGLGSNAKFTATEGIVSENIDSTGYYFNTSAKIDQGSSGGGAFLKNSGCLAGLPTFALAGEVESLGRILNANKLKDEFLNKVISF